MLKYNTLESVEKSRSKTCDLLMFCIKPYKIKMMSEKVVGYILLFAGLGIMVFAFSQIYLVFTNQAKIPRIFGPSANSTRSSSSDELSQLQNSKSLLNGQGGLPQINLIPQDTINETLNTIAYYFLMSFVLGFGFKIASLGVMTIRPIVVKLKAREIEVVEHDHEKTHQGTTV